MNRRPPADGTDQATRILAPPPLLHLAVLGVALALHLGWPLSPALPSAVSRAVGGALLAGAALVIGWGVVSLRRADTPLDPNRTALHLVTRGVFARTRNPLYLGLSIAHTGLALLVPSLWVLVSALIATLLVDIGVIRAEEKRLDAAFGPAYRDYRARVRRWL